MSQNHLVAIETFTEVKHNEHKHFTNNFKARSILNSTLTLHKSKR